MQLAHTADLSKRELAAVRGLIFTAFDSVDEDDWEFVWPVSVELDLAGDLTCDFRPGSYW